MADAMESNRLLNCSNDLQSDQWRPPDALNEDDRKEGKLSWPRNMKALVAVARVPRWRGWLFVFTSPMVCFFTSRCFALKNLVAMYGSLQDYTPGFTFAVLGLGFVEDLVCATYFACSLWLLDSVLRHLDGVGVRVRAITKFTVSWLLFFAMMAPFVADMLLVVNRNMRFSFDLVAALIRVREFLRDAPVSSEELQRGYLAAATLVVATTLFAAVRTCASWSDLTCRNSTRRPLRIAPRPEVAALKCAEYGEIDLADDSDRPMTKKNGKKSKETHPFRKLICQQALPITAAVLGLVILPVIAVALSCACSPFVAFSALNATLNELLAHALQPAPIAPPTGPKRDVPWVEQFIHPTEVHTLFGEDAVYRLTTGFQGDLAFDVDVSRDNPPNVLVIGVESFRFRDSRYLVGDEDPSNLFKGTNLTVTPNFDRWAKRGIGLRNMWSSNPTSRSLESMLFAQTPYDSSVKSGITGGRKHTKLSGLPQLFLAKGYETFFTTGCSMGLDGWDVFLPSHGFSNVWNNRKMVKVVESDYGIAHSEWYGEERRGFNWGVHDDLSFRVLGDLLINKTKEQTERMRKGEAKNPLFLTHYTISSHHPFKARPTWYAEAEKPDFSALYEGEKYSENIKNYLEMRHFTDMELGKFMDRLSNEGVLNDTIVVIMGDHGQAPEVAILYTEEESLTRVAGAIIAEGRLGRSAGLVIEDAVQQYDILNTLADITGVPEGGFVQHGIGRSLKRKVRVGERSVFSNVPGFKMSVVRGHQRLRYDRATDWMMLHNTETDFHMEFDLFPDLAVEERAEWMLWRENGRRISAYYTARLDGNCLLAVNCSTER